MRFVYFAAILLSTIFQVDGFSPVFDNNGRGGVKVGASASEAATAETYTVTPIKSLDGVVTLPGSKSLSNRCLLLAALSEGTRKVDNLLESNECKESPQRNVGDKREGQLTCEAEKRQ